MMRFQWWHYVNLTVTLVYILGILMTIEAFAGVDIPRIFSGIIGGLLLLAAMWEGYRLINKKYIGH